jgi:signal transduction histidine kinase
LSFFGGDLSWVDARKPDLVAAIDLAGVVKHVTVLEFMPELKADAVLVNKLHSLPNVTVHKNAQTTEITGADGKVNGIRFKHRDSGVDRDVALEGVFVQIGLVPNTEWLGETVKRTRFGEIEIDARGATSLPALDDSLLVWLSRVIGEDINVFAGSGLRASSERNLFASGLLPTRTPGETYRALVLDGRPTFLARETVGAYEYRVASALVRVGDEQAIVSVPLTLRQRGIERQVDALDRRVLLAAIAFILLGSFIGYWAAERISDPVSRLTRATRRLASGDLDAHVLVRTSDELGRLVEAFNGMADDLRRQRTQLERTNRLEAWAEMARQVAHDIKNPLTPIQLNAEHLRRVHEDRGRPLGTLVDDCVANILLQVRLLRQLSAEFSSFASAPQARPTAVPLAPLLEEILAPYASALAGRIAITHEGAEDATLFVDRVLLARALTNVIENALHAMPGTGSLVVRAQPPADGTQRLDVVDTGVGMDAEALGRIFEPYFSTKATGTGLGLTIARRNVELNGGTIAVASTRGGGTTVSLTLPLAGAGA